MESSPSRRERRGQSEGIQGHVRDVGRLLSFNIPPRTSITMTVGADDAHLSRNGSLWGWSARFSVFSEEGSLRIAISPLVSSVSPLEVCPQAREHRDSRVSHPGRLRVEGYSSQPTEESGQALDHKGECDQSENSATKTPQL